MEHIHSDRLLKRPLMNWGRGGSLSAMGGRWMDKEGWMRMERLMHRGRDEDG